MLVKEQSNYMFKTKIIANYLPQYHEIPENNCFWGKGYTDWVAVKKSKPLFENHLQPRRPENDNYYSLDNKEVIKWQAQLAKNNGIYGFGIYHYWFSSDMQLLEKPAELLFEAKDIDINYMFIWDNGSWKRTWSNVKRGNDWAPEFDDKKELENENSDNGMLAELKYGNEKDWKIHFDYLCKFFKDRRYIKKDNCPMFGFFQPDNDYEIVKKMCEYWDALAKENGFNGMCFISKCNYKKADLDYSFKYEPLSVNTRKEVMLSRIQNIKNRHFPRLRIYNYDQVWKKIIHDARYCKNSNQFFGAFVGFDDTPRRGKKAKIILGQTPDKFESYLRELFKISQEKHKEYLFLTAWNEWGEGAYLEPDSIYGDRYLKAVKRVVGE